MSIEYPYGENATLLGDLPPEWTRETRDTVLTALQAVNQILNTLPYEIEACIVNSLLLNHAMTTVDPVAQIRLACEGLEKLVRRTQH